MLKALMKKQLLELNSFYFQSRKTGKRRTRAGVIGYFALYAALFVYLGFVFYMMADGIIEPLMAVGMDWLYFCLMGVTATALGTFGSVFTTYAGLYQAKDNELLLAMPIQPWKILAARVIGVLVTGLLYEGVVLIPAVIVRCLHGGVNAARIVGMLLMCVNVALVVTVLTCILGWLVALIAVRIKGKSWITALISLVFLGGYMYLCSNSWELIEELILNIGTFGAKLKGWLYPFYVMGCAAEGSVTAMLGLTAACLAALLTVWLVLSRTFLHIATRHMDAGSRRRGAVRFDRLRSGSIDLALLGREWRRFTSSATYMLNAGLSTVLLPVMAIFAVIKRGDVLGAILPVFMRIPGMNALILLVLTAVLCLIAGMNAVTAPSVSLEGRSIWIAQTLPVSTGRILRAKLALHMLVTAPVALISGAVLAWVFGLPAAWAALMLLTLAAYILMIGEIGLAVNLKLPNLSWTNEVVPVKQGLSVMITLFGGWATIGALAGLYYLLRNQLTPIPYLGICAALFVMVDVILALWLRYRGTAIYDHL